MQKIMPCLWFNWNALEATEFYKTVFKDNFRIGDITYYNDANPYAKPGSVMTIEFEIFGQDYMALNAGPDFPFTDAVSFVIDCKDQAEIDYYWDALMKDGGHPEQCGWLRDKFGVPWQVVNGNWKEFYQDPNSAKSKAAMTVMMQQIKIDIAEIEKAYNEA